MSVHGSPSDLAPVIPLFGTKKQPASERFEASAHPSKGEHSETTDVATPTSITDRRSSTDNARPETAETGDRWAIPGLTNDGVNRSVQSDDTIADSQGGAEVVSLFSRSLGRSSGDGSDHAMPEKSADEVREAAAEKLVRKLRARSLSVSEARALLRSEAVAAEDIDDIVDDFLRRGYLDDQVLAEQLVMSGATRKAQGRVALSRSLAQRGIPRDIIDAALADSPDDDAERALEYARTKARSLSRLDFDTALRRLVGQLSRRGYGGSIAMTAARTALQEASISTKPRSGVRFE